MRKMYRGQATIEAAIVIPLLVLMTLLFFAIQIRMEAQTELDAAVSLAAAAAAEAPACNANSGCQVQNTAAARTFNDTIKQYTGFSSLPADTFLSGCGNHTATSSTPITCVGHAKLTFINVSLGGKLTTNALTITSTFSATPSNHRTLCGYIGPSCVSQ